MKESKIAIPFQAGLSCSRHTKGHNDSLSPYMKNIFTFRKK